jgi:hypothetical protein
MQHIHLRRCNEAAEVLTVSLAFVAVTSTLGMLVVLTSMFVSSSLVREKETRYSQTVDTLRRNLRVLRIINLDTLYAVLFWQSSFWVLVFVLMLQFISLHSRQDLIATTYHHVRCRVTSVAYPGGGTRGT